MNYLHENMKDVLWSREFSDSAFNLNKSAIRKLINQGLISSPYNGIRNDSQIVYNIINQLDNSGNLKIALNILPFKSPYESYETSQLNREFETLIGLNFDKWGRPTM